jgi:hypothetical protein
MLTGKSFSVAVTLAIVALIGDTTAGLGQTVPAEQPSPEAVAKLIAQLGAEDFRSRQEAGDQLVKLGDPVLPALRKAATAKIELEIKRRIELVVIRIEAASVEKLAKAYCFKHGLAREKLEAFKSALAPEGRVFRYKLPAVTAKEKRDELSEPYAFLFVDPASGNVYDVKRIPGGDTTLDQRTWAILRLMGTKVADKDHAEALMAGLSRIGELLHQAAIHEDPMWVRVAEVTKGTRWVEAGKTYHADCTIGLRLTMTVDDDGYVTGFHMGNIR